MTEPIQTINLVTTDLFPDTVADLLFGKTIPISLILKPHQTEIDVIITGYNLPEITNLTIRNFLRQETKTSFHITVIESSGSREVFNQLLNHPQVSKILINNNYNITGQKHGYGSYSMALSSTIGQHFSTSPYLFFSHSDMIATKTDFLTTFLNQLRQHHAKIASFTQRHFIPFTGCMLVDRTLIKENPNINWLPQNDSPYTISNTISDLSKPYWKSNNNYDYVSGVDCGESYIYYLLQQGEPVVIGASRGNEADYWGDPLDKFDFQDSQQFQLNLATKFPLIYLPLNQNLPNFQEKYPYIVKRPLLSTILQMKPKYWRYCFDETGDLAFIHYSRGTTLRQIKPWVNFINRYFPDTVKI